MKYAKPEEWMRLPREKGGREKRGLWRQSCLKTSLCMHFRALQTVRSSVWGAGLWNKFCVSQGVTQKVSSAHRTGHRFQQEDLHHLSPWCVTLQENVNVKPTKDLCQHSNAAHFWNPVQRRFIRHWCLISFSWNFDCNTLFFWLFKLLLYFNHCHKIFCVEWKLSLVPKERERKARRKKLMGGSFSSKNASMWKLS